MNKLFQGLVAVAATCACAGVMAQAADTLAPPMSYLGKSGTLYELVLQQPAANIPGLMPATEMAQKHPPMIVDIDAPPPGLQASLSSPALQNAAPTLAAAVVGANFEGPGVGLSGFNMTGAPPDTTIAVGPNHVVAWVNSMFAMMDKSGNVLSLANGNTLFVGTGNLCETTNRGDPILQYDRQARRWILSQFAFNVNGAGSPIAPYLQCIAVSTSDNPLGTYHRYAIQFSSQTTNNFNDYGKLGIFNDAYYTAYNVFGGSPAGSNTGVALCASDRTKMLAGDPTATTLCAPVTFYGGGASFLPADVDGTTAPTTTAQGNIFMRLSTAPALRMVKLKPDFAAGTVTLNDGFGGATGSFVNMPLAATVRACNGGGGTCVPQAGTTTKLDTLGDRLMYRLAYRNRGGVDSLVVSHAVDPDGAGSRAAAVRWYEIRSPFSATPTMYQNATYNPDGNDRWMSSIAMDKAGNMMMGYSVSSAAMKPAVRVTGRLRSDIRNQMRAEQSLIEGTGAQTVRSSGTALTRWGDYTTMQVDPADDCTFWFIGQYLAADGVFNWRTRVGSYRFANCV